MPVPGVALRSLGFLTIGLFDPADPVHGHRSTLQLIELGEQLGFDSVWLRHRHLQFGISSPVTMMAAASQRTQRIHLGTAVTPVGWENPLRMAEDLATADLLSGGRINPGVSVGVPMHYEQVKSSLYPDTADVEDFSYARVERLLRLVEGHPASSFQGREGHEDFSDRVEPHSPGLRARMWYGAGSLRSARWAGTAALNLLTSSLVLADDPRYDTGPWDFGEIQRDQILEFRAAHPSASAARVSQGMVVIPIDGATSAQRERYAAYVAGRAGRASKPQGPRRAVFGPDLLGTSEQIAEALYANAAFREVDEVAFALPFTFGHADYVQILTDIAARLGPALGWRPSSE